MMETNSLSLKAQNYAERMHKGQLKKDGTTAVIEHLSDVVSKLKILGVPDEVVAAGWLHDILEDTKTSQSQISEMFGHNVAILVSSLTKDRSAGKMQDAFYIEKLKKAPIFAKLIKMCDIASNLEKIDASKLSYQEKQKTINKINTYFDAIVDFMYEQIPANSEINRILKQINTIIQKYQNKI